MLTFWTRLVYFTQLKVGLFKCNNQIKCSIFIALSVNSNKVPSKVHFFCSFLSQRHHNFKILAFTGNLTTSIQYHINIMYFNLLSDYWKHFCKQAAKKKISVNPEWFSFFNKIKSNFIIKNSSNWNLITCVSFSWNTFLRKWKRIALWIIPRIILFVWLEYYKFYSLLMPNIHFIVKV